jgi:Kyakuja-Dileera-Zisupton transposase
MKVPISVLDGCMDSFVAADEKRTKANPHVFADTGVMALLCRHDHPLWLVNMNTAGERQFFAIALVLKLFKHLPGTARVGLLYDIACQLERSCRKWDFLGELADRLQFAVSVFHAYGHRWPCQLVYHPRKCQGFGLSDGEGCERFWSAIKFLIPSLRVSGYHRRRFVLDIQVAHMRTKSVEALASWLVRRWKAVERRQVTSQSTLDSLLWDSGTYSAQWASQVEYQTRPLARVSKNAGKKAMEEILSLSAV